MKRFFPLALLLLFLTACGAFPSGPALPAPPPAASEAAPPSALEPTALLTPEPEPTPPEPEAVTATLVICGDVMSHMPQTNDAYDPESGDYRYDDCLQYVEPWIAGADYAVANLETVLGGGPYHGFPLFNSPDGLAYSLKRAGFDLVSTANNHCMDQGYSGLVRTLDILDDAGLQHVGTYRTQEEADQDHGIAVADVGGISVAFLAYTYSTNGIPVKAACDFSVNRFNVDYMTHVADLDEEKVSADLAAAQALEPDLIAVLIHWGNEYHTAPSAYQKEVADFLFEHGADLVLGGHPHVMQPMEVRELPDGRTGFLAYSLGNFISAQSDRYTDTTAILRLELTKDPAHPHTQVTDVSYVPCLMVNRGKGTDPRFLLMDVPRAMAEFEAGTSEYVTQRVYERLAQAREDCQVLLGLGTELTALETDGS